MTDTPVTTERIAPYAHLHMFERPRHAKYERIMMRIDSTYNAVCERAGLERQQREAEIYARYDAIVSASYERHYNTTAPGAPGPRAIAEHSDDFLQALSGSDREIAASGNIHLEIVRKASATRWHRHEIARAAYKRICDRAGMTMIY